MDGERPMEQPQTAVVVVATPITEDGRTSSRPSSSRARARRRRNRPASAEVGDRDSSVERERVRGRRRPTSAATFGSPDRVHVSATSAVPPTPESYDAWGALETPLQSVDEGPGDNGARIPAKEDTDEERLERHLRLERRSKRRERGRSTRSASRRDNDTGGERERRSGGSRRGHSARRRSGRDNYDDNEEVLEDMHRVPEERGSVERPATATGSIRVPQTPSDRMYEQHGSMGMGRPATAGTTRVPHAPSNFRPSSASIAPFRPASARPTSRPLEMVGMPPNMDGRNWVQPNRPAVEEQLKRQQRQRSARRVNSARSTRSFEERERLANQDMVRAAEGVKPEPWMIAEEDSEQKSKWWIKSKAVQVAAAVTHSVDGKVKVKQKLNFDGSPKTQQQARKEQKKDAVEVFIFEHQRELIEYFQSGLFQMQLPKATSLIRKALGVRPGLRRLLALLCCATLAIGAYAVYLVVQVDFARAELDELRSDGASSRNGEEADSTRTYSTTVALSRNVIPYKQFARVCRCGHRPARPVATHVVAFEALVNHVYGDHTAANSGRSQLVSGISLYDVSVPWSLASSAMTSGSSGYCGAEADPSRHENHECADQLGEHFGATAKLLWQWSPDKIGEGIPARDAKFFRFPTVQGLRPVF